MRRARPIVTARLVRRGSEEEGFDRAFWREIPPERRLELVWDMVLEAREWGGNGGDEPRLQRSVARIQPR